MPELPEVETIKRGLEPLIVKKVIKAVKPDVTTPKCFQGQVEQIVGAIVIGIRRRGKALLIDLDNKMSLMVHLRMTGQLIWRGDALSERITSSDSPVRGGSIINTASLRASNFPRTSSPVLGATTEFAAGHPSKNFTAELPNSQTRVSFVFTDGVLYFNDQRKFGFVKVLPTEAVEQDKFIAELAKEPWEMSVQELVAACSRHKKSPIKAVLLDQKVIAGLGNIYADESLFYASVHPATPAGNLTEAEIGLILEGACKVMEASINSGGSTMATYIKPDGTTGDYLELFAKVFRREGKPCERCGEIILKTRVAGRGTHYCPSCQKAPHNFSIVKDMSSKKLPLRGSKKA